MIEICGKLTTKSSINCMLNNIERHTAHTIVSWPNPWYHCCCRPDEVKTRGIVSQCTDLVIPEYSGLITTMYNVSYCVYSAIFILIHWSLVSPYNHIELGQHWFRQWFRARQQAYLNQSWIVISQVMRNSLEFNVIDYTQVLLIRICSKITHLHIWNDVSSG